MDIELKQIKELLLKVVNCNWHGQQHVLCDPICACPCFKPLETAWKKECECICHKDHECKCGTWVETRDPQLQDIASESEMGRPMEKECKELRKAICGCTYCLDAYCKKHGCFHIKSYVDSAKEEFLEKKFKRIEGQFTWFKNELRSLVKLAREGKA